MLKLILQGSAALAVSVIAGYLLLVAAPSNIKPGRKAASLRRYVARLKFRANLPAAPTSSVMKGSTGQRMVLPTDGRRGPRDLEAAIREAAKGKQLTSPLEFATSDWSSKEFYYFRPFTVQVNGEFRQVVEFLQAVSTGSAQLRMVKTASLRPVAGRDEVALSLEAHAFRYREEDSAAAERKATTREFVGRPQ
jgi:hypothetical protein